MKELFVVESGTISQATADRLEQNGYRVVVVPPGRLDGVRVEGSPISLRDQFAGIVIGALVQTYLDRKVDILTEMAYVVADAMMIARAKRIPDEEAAT